MLHRVSWTALTVLFQSLRLVGMSKVIECNFLIFRLCEDAVEGLSRMRASNTDKPVVPKNAGSIVASLHQDR
jgi:hypothetical protein